MSEHDHPAPAGGPGRERPGAGDAIPSAPGAGLPGADADRPNAAGQPKDASSDQDPGAGNAPDDPTRAEGPGGGSGLIGAREPVDEPIASGGGATVGRGADGSAEPTGAAAADTGTDDGTSDEPTRVEASSGEGPGAPTGPVDETTRTTGPGEARGTPAPGSAVGGSAAGGFAVGGPAAGGPAAGGVPAGGPAAGGRASGSAGPTGATAAGAGGGWVPPPPPPGPPGPAGPAGPYPPYPPAAPRRRLTRSRQRRVLAGVAGGLGEYTGIDPVLFRVLFAVLTVFGGAGILLYVIGWLFLPEQDQPSSPAEALIGRGRGSDAVQAILLAIVALVVAGVLVSGDGRDVVLLALVVVGAVLLARHLDETRDRPAAPAPVPAPPAVPPSAPGPYEPYRAHPPYPPYPAYQPYQVPPPDVSPADPYTTATTTATVVPETTGQKRESSLLGRLTLSLLLLVLGVTAALDAAGAVEPQARHYLALTVGVIGLGLLVGAWRGRARGLIWLGLPLTIALVAVGASEVRLSGGVGDRQYGPLSVAEIQDRYEVGVGNLELDLSDVDFAGESVSTTAAAGVGHVGVTVPREVDVDVVGRAGIGEADLFGEKANGTSPERTVVDEGPDGAGGGHLRLVLDVGVGKVEVDRETA
jgi:phage shock protein PspC (stress-responsive transcriptional regulator)